MTLCENSRALALFADARREHGWDAIEIEGETIRVVEEPLDGTESPRPESGSTLASDGTRMATFRLSLAIREPIDSEQDAHVAGVDGDLIRNPSPVEIRIHDRANLYAAKAPSESIKKQITESAPNVVVHDTDDVLHCGVAVDASDLEFDAATEAPRIISETDDREIHDEDSPLQITAEHPDTGLTYRLIYLNEYFGPVS